MTLRKFPEDLNGLAWESIKSMNWNTKVQKSGSGKVRTLTTQLLPNWTIETKFQILTDEQYRKLLGFVALFGIESHDLPGAGREVAVGVLWSDALGTGCYDFGDDTFDEG